MSVELGIQVVRSITLVAECSIHEPSLRKARPPFARLASPIRVEPLHESCSCLLTRLDQVLSQGVYIGGRAGNDQLRRSKPTHGGGSPASNLLAGGA